MTDRSVKRGRWGELIREPDDGEGWDLPLSAKEEPRAVLMDDGDDSPRPSPSPSSVHAWGSRDSRDDGDLPAAPSRKMPAKRKAPKEETADETFKRALRSASAMLARAEYPPDALRRKLNEKGFERAIIEDVIDRLHGAGLLNENAMAERRAEYLYRVKGYGPLRIGRELRRLGFSSSAVALVDLTDAAFDFPKKAYQILMRCRYDEEAPAIRRLMAYGYTLSAAKKAWAAYREAEE